MAVMLTEYNVYDTKKLLEQILRATLNGDRVMILCEPGQGRSVVQRNRVMLSRQRNKNQSKGLRNKKFRLHSSIHPHTDRSGKRHDCIVMWQSRNDNHLMAEILERMLTDESR